MFRRLKAITTEWLPVAVPLLFVLAGIFAAVALYFGPWAGVLVLAGLAVVWLARGGR